MNWGSVDGRTQTRLPWDSWQKRYVLSGATIWYHVVFSNARTPYRQAETDLIRALSAAPRGVVPAPAAMAPTEPTRRRRRAR